MKGIKFDYGLMKATPSNEDQIITAVKEHVAGHKAENIVRNLGISKRPFINVGVLAWVCVGPEERIDMVVFNRI